MEQKSDFCSTLLLYNFLAIEFRQSGLLARGQVSEEPPSEVGAGPPFSAKASRSKIQKWCITETVTAKLKIDRLVDLEKRLSGFKNCCLAVNAAPIREPNAKPSLFANLEPSEPV